MPNQAPQRQDELLITRGAPPSEARRFQRSARTSEYTRIADGIYVRGQDLQAQIAIVRRRWHSIVAALAPDAVVSYRSAYAGGMTESSIIFVSHPTRFNRNVQLPGLKVVLVKGPGRLPGDLPLGNQRLYLASQPRQLLENLTRAYGKNGKSAGSVAVEERLLAILNANGAAAINRIREDARELAPELAMHSQFALLDALIGSLLATQAQNHLKTRAGRLAAKSTPVDLERITRFEILAARLRAEPLPRNIATVVTEPARSNFAFLEAYFSNFVEGTEFAIEEARDIALQGRIVERRPKDSHDILAVFDMATRSPWRDAVPAFGKDYPEQLAQRHALMMKQRPEVNPGQFKLAPNRAGETWFVEPRFVRGTLIEGSLLGASVPEGLARAIFYAFLISEIHPFADGNGRISRLVMNAELSRMGETRIIIPTLFHEEYVDCQRQLSRHNDPTGHIHALTLMQQWTATFEYSNTNSLISAVRRTNALERSRTSFQLTTPDGLPLRRLQ